MHLGARHQLAAQRRRQQAVGDILGEHLKLELFSELNIYEQAVQKEKEVAYNKLRHERKLKSIVGNNTAVNSSKKKSRNKKKKKKASPAYKLSYSDDDNDDDGSKRKPVREKIDPITMSIMCQERVRKKILQEKEEKEKLLHQKELKEERMEIDNIKAKQKASEAKRRVIRRRRRQKEEYAEELNNLILKLPNSVDATNLTRLLNPEFQPKYVYDKACLSEDEKRVQTIMARMDLYS